MRGEGVGGDGSEGSIVKRYLADEPYFCFVFLCCVRGDILFFVLLLST